MKRNCTPILMLVQILALQANAQVEDSECTPSKAWVLNDDFRFVASSDQGAVGDVVAIDVGLVSKVPFDGPSTFDFIMCVDGSRLEMLGEPEYSKELDAVAGMSEFFVYQGQDGTIGLHFGSGMGIAAANGFFPSSEPLPLLTLYFRVKGTPGDLTRLEFCDGFRDEYDACHYSKAIYSVPGDRVIIMSQSHVDGEVRILPGDPTRPDPPALPPEAMVYPEPPTTESAGILLELDGTVARPGTQDVPVPVYATSNLEFSGFALSVPFPAQYLELSRIEQHTRPGAFFIDNERGFFALAMMNSSRRVGAEGERLKLATLYFNVKESAAAVQELTPRLEDFSIDDRQYFNCLRIRHLGGESLERPLTANVEPLVVTDGLLKIQNEPAPLGDVNLDYEVSITDAVAILGWLFQGEGDLICPRAADFNGDGNVNISDAIGILQYLFQGTGLEPGPPVFCDQ